MRQPVAATPTPVDVQIRELLADSGLSGADVGLHIVDLQSNQVIFSRNAEALLIPASNVKVVSTAAVLKALGSDYRFMTEVRGLLTPDGTTSDLSLQSFGDPWLIPERVWYLANRLYVSGLREVQGDLVVDDSYFSGPQMAAGWEQDTTSSAYMAPVGAVSVGFNSILVSVRPGLPGAAATITIDPRSAYTLVRGVVETVDQGSTQVEVDVVAEGGRSVVKVKGRIHVSESPRGYWRRIEHPALFAGEVFRYTLEQVGVLVRGQVRIGAADPTSPIIVSIESPRVAELVQKVNKYSNNFMAEQMLRAAGAVVFGAPATPEKGLQVVAAFMTALGSPPDSYTLGNASGLHDVNRLSARQLVDVLAAGFRDPRVGPEFIVSLAVSGGVGTLSDRMAGPEVSGLVRAKTGTLSSACALSGYVRLDSGHVLAFSMLVNRYQHGISRVWEVQDRLGGVLAAIDRTSAVTRPPDAAVNAMTTQEGNGASL